ncbi:MAG: hypothetical protein JXB36_04725 [Gammaproteobacteria bacterium]|nr:hypothetical protein [Gammaproteobacteria bacterium]
MPRRHEIQRTPAILAAALLPLAAVPPAVRGEVPLYHIIDIGTLGGEQTIALDLNDAGEITGDSELPDGSVHAFLYVDGEMLDLGTLGGFDSHGNALNEAGQVTGESSTAEGTHAFLYSDGEMLDLGTIGGTFSSGSDVNDAAEVTGIATTADGDYHPFLYADGQMHDAGTLGDRFSAGLAINDGGEFVGYYTRDFESHAFLYSDGRLLDLAPASVVSYIEPFRRSINSAGHVAGMYRPAGSNRAFLYRDGGAVDLGTLGGEFSSAFALNDASEVAGSSTTAEGDTHAFLYSDGTMHDLGTLGGAFSVGYAVNEAGEVIGNSRDAEGGGLRAFVYRNGSMRELDLGGFGALESFAVDVNEHGQVIGWYTLPGEPEVEGSDGRSFLATPIPLLLSRLLDRVTGAGPGRALASTIRQAIRRYDDRNRAGACAVLGSFALQVRVLSSARRLSDDGADRLRASARAVRGALGC